MRCGEGERVGGVGSSGGQLLHRGRQLGPEITEGVTHEGGVSLLGYSTSCPTHQPNLETGESSNSSGIKHMCVCTCM